MAEGTEDAAPLAEGQEEAGAAAGLLESVEVGEEALPSVRRKEKPPPLEGPGSGLQEAAVRGRSSDRWTYSDGDHRGLGQGLMNRPKGASTEWRERCFMEDSGEEWSYSTVPGNRTMEVLRERFGEVRGREPGLWSVPDESDQGQWSLPGGLARRSSPPRSRMDSPRYQGAARQPEVPRGSGVSAPTTAVPSGTTPWDSVTGRPRQQPLRPDGGVLAQGMPLGPWGQGLAWGPPPLTVVYDGHPDRLAMFLGQVINHMDQYGPAYTSQWAMVVAVTACLQGEAAAWAADLYGDHARELGDLGLFLEALRARFEDISRVLRAEAEVLDLRQQGRPAVRYVGEFRKVAGRLRSWPERLLVHHFKAGLDSALRRACVVRGVPARLQDWFRVAIELDIGLQDTRGRSEGVTGGRRPAEKVKVEERPGLPVAKANPVPPPRPGIRCFRCDQPGHRAAECPLPPARMVSPATSTRALPARKTSERSRTAYQAADDSRRDTTPPLATGPVTTHTVPTEDLEDLELEDDPMEDPW
ncbi:uncharacterized protein M6D78_010313 [Vipera latastei]